MSPTRALIQPPLTTVAVDSRRLGEQAAAILLDQLAESAAEPAAFHRRRRLVVRASLRCRPRSPERKPPDMTDQHGWGLIGASTIAKEHMIGAIRAQPAARSWR